MRFNLAGLVSAALVLACSSNPGAAGTSPAPGTAPASGDAAAVDFSGDWEFSATVRDSVIEGTARIWRTAEGYAGSIQRPGSGSVSLRSFQATASRFVMTSESYGELYTFEGQLNTRTTIVGTLRTRIGFGRLVMRRR